jgi:hypothetical protein
MNVTMPVQHHDDMILTESHFDDCVIELNVNHQRTRFHTESSSQQRKSKVFFDTRPPESVEAIQLLEIAVQFSITTLVYGTKMKISSQPSHATEALDEMLVLIDAPEPYLPVDSTSSDTFDNLLLGEVSDVAIDDCENASESSLFSFDSPLIFDELEIDTPISSFEANEDMLLEEATYNSHSFLQEEQTQQADCLLDSNIQKQKPQDIDSFHSPIQPQSEVESDGEFLPLLDEQRVKDGSGSEQNCTPCFVDIADVLEAYLSLVFRGRMSQGLKQARIVQNGFKSHLCQLLPSIFDRRYLDVCLGVY